MSGSARRGYGKAGGTAAVAALLLLLAGCVTTTGGPAGGPAGAGAGAPGALPPIDWRTAIAPGGDVVDVEVTDRAGFYRVERVELVAPNGGAVPAFEMTRRTESGGYDPLYGPGPHGSIGVFGGSSGHVGVGVGLGFSTFDLAGPAYRPPVTRTQARLRVPDPDSYRATARDWSIVVYLADASGLSSMARIPAPVPPSPPPSPDGASARPDGPAAP